MEWKQWKQGVGGAVNIIIFFFFLCRTLDIASSRLCDRSREEEGVENVGRKRYLFWIFPTKIL